MVPFLHTQLAVVGSNGLVSVGRGHVTFVSFVPDGTGWFARYSSNQCIYGPDISAFPSTWKVLVHELEQNHPRKDECIDFAAFGQHELLLVRFENGNSQMVLPEDLAVRSRISAELVREVEERLADGWTFGNRTTLCGFDTKRWFIEWVRGSSAIFRYNTGDGEKSKEDLERVKSVLSGVGSDAALVASHNNAHLVSLSFQKSFRGCLLTLPQDRGQFGLRSTVGRQQMVVVRCYDETQPTPITPQNTEWKTGSNAIQYCDLSFNLVGLYRGSIAFRGSSSARQLL